MSYIGVFVCVPGEFDSCEGLGHCVWVLFPVSVYDNDIDAVWVLCGKDFYD